MYCVRSVRFRVLLHILPVYLKLQHTFVSASRDRPLRDDSLIHGVSAPSATPPSRRRTAVVKRGDNKNQLTWKSVPRVVELRYPRNF